jgi:xylan 1,4-beta-xylosidase
MLNSDVRRRGGWASWLALLSLVLAVGCAPAPKVAAPASAPAATWLAAWGSAQLEQAAPPAGTPELVNGKPVAAAWRQPLRDVTLRQIVRVSAAGTALRVRVSNLFGREPLQLASASVALVQGEPGTAQPVLQAASQRGLTFNGQRALSLAPGAEAWSDPVDLTVPRGADLAVQWHVQSAPAVATVHPGSRIQSWAVPGARRDAAAWPDAAARDGWWHLAAVDVRGATAQPVLAAIGDSITDGYGVSPGSYQRWTDALTRRLAASGRDAAVVNTGIGGNRLLRDGLGPKVLSRFDRDALDRSGATHAVVLIGVNDLGSSHRGKTTTPASRAALLAEMKEGFTTLARRARERGVCLLVSTVMPYGGSGYYQPGPENEADRQALNEWIRRSGTFDAVLDYDALARDPAKPTHLRADWDNDGLHPSMAGYKAMAEAFPLDFLQRRCNPAPATPAAAAMPATFDNPVVSGFASDPSVCRSGEDYYLVTSTFEYLPGLPIYHSRDLVNWKLIANALTRESQINFADRRSSRAIFAPTIRCEAGRFYIVTTDVDGIGNFFITADHPAGPWSDPVRLPEPVFGMDPSFFFDDDGTVYYTRHGGGERGGVYQARIDLKAGKLLEEPRLIWSGMGGIWPEGPHLYKRNGWYYIMIAEGGTSYDHRITMGRSRSPWGPFEAHPDNPILTHRNLPDHPLQALGHADLVMTPKGDWWATLLAIRPQAANGGRHHHIGRETLLAPVRWREDDWPEFGQNKALAQPQPTAGLPTWAPWPQPPVRETFAADKPLPPHWTFLRTLASGRWSLTARPGQLRLIGAQNGLDVVGTPAFVGRRQEKLNQRFAAELDFKPAAEGDAAGLAVRMNESHHLLLRRTGVSAPRMECLQQLGGKPIIQGSATVPAGPLQLQVLAEPARYTLSWRAVGQQTWQPLCSVPTWQLSTETATGFIGVYLGLYAVSATATPAVGDFSWVDFEALGP